MYKTTRQLSLVMLLIALILMIAASTVAAPTAVIRVSVASDGAQSDNASYEASISDDGRYVAFKSFATTLIPNDTNGITGDIFVHDIVTGTTEIVSIANDGTQGNSASSEPSISADGRYVAFMSLATNLVPGDTNNAFDIFVYDRDTDTIERVPVGTGGTQGGFSDESRSPSISADGRYVTFYSEAQLAPTATNNFTQIFVHDRQNNITEHVSLSDEGAAANENCNSPVISGNGRYVTFITTSNNLVANDTNNRYDAFVYDRDTDTIERVSLNLDGTQATGGSGAIYPTINGDGRYVAYRSRFTTLPLGLYIYDRDTDTLEQFSDTGDFLDMSANGRYVTYQDTHIFVYDQQTGTTIRASEPVDGSDPSTGSGDPSISADGGVVAYESGATNLVSGDTNGYVDIFVSVLNTAPVAVDDNYEAMALVGQAINIGANEGVLLNDTDPENDPLTAILDQAPAKGQLTLNLDGSFDYLPDEGAIGNDTFTYYADDGNTTSATPATVTITFVDPEGMPPRLYPLDGATLTGDNAWDWGRFTFKHLDGVEWYQVWIGLADYSVPAVVYDWYQASQICSAGICTIPVDIWLTNGDYRWWMTYWGPDVPDYGQYWNQTTFTVGFSPPSAFTMTDPVDATTINDEPNYIEWERDPNTLWYQVWVGPDNYSTSQYLGWLDAREECDMSICTLYVSGESFPDGGYEVWIEMWGPGGYLTWLDVNGGNAAATFNVDTSGAAPAPQIEPAP